MVKAVLAADPSLRGIPLYPVIAPAEETMPLIVYRRYGLDPEQVKSGRPADTTGVEMEIWTGSYEEGVELAERVRAALDGITATASGMRMRSCFLEDAYEDGTADGIHVQALKFRMRM